MATVVGETVTFVESLELKVTVTLVGAGADKATGKLTDWFGAAATAAGTMIAP